jgi:hypothetical protein
MHYVALAQVLILLSLANGSPVIVPVLLSLIRLFFWRICYWRVDLVGAITPASLIQTFGNLLEPPPLSPIDTAQEFSQFAIGLNIPDNEGWEGPSALPHHLIRGNKYPLLILGPDAGPSVALEGDNRCIEFHLGHSPSFLASTLLAFCDFTRFLLVWRSAQRINSPLTIV